MRFHLIWFAFLYVILFSLAAFAQNKIDKNQVIIETKLGEIEVEIYTKQAPLTAANFFKYVEGGLYNGGVFHRTVKMDNQPDNKVLIEVIQGGINPEQKEHPPIPLERTNKTGITHTNGTISMARNGPDTATGDFFICIGNQPSLDYGGKRNPDGQGFAAFGKVIKGMDVVKKIQAAPANGQTLSPVIEIVGIRRK